MWQVAMVANAIVAVAYVAISRAILVPLVRAGELRSNKLGAATALIFFTCAVHHGSHSVHMLMPYAGIGVPQGMAMREAFDGTQASWDVVTAGVGLYYWSLRRSYARLLIGAKLFEDHKQRRREALEIHDTIVQGIVTAQLAQRTGRAEESTRALDATLDEARRLVDRLLREAGGGGAPDAGDFVRHRAAQIGSR